jgi:hypothetical protein
MNVINITEPADGLLSCPAKSHFLEVLYEEDGNDR